MSYITAGPLAGRAAGNGRGLPRRRGGCGRQTRRPGEGAEKMPAPGHRRRAREGGWGSGQRPRYWRRSTGGCRWGPVRRRRQWPAGKAKHGRWPIIGSSPPASSRRSASRPGSTGSRCRRRTRSGPRREASPARQSAWSGRWRTHKTELNAARRRPERG